MADALTLRFRKKFPKGALIDADLQVELDPPNVTVLFGPSGSGKTTILRALAGLERSADCVIHFGRETWADDKSWGVYSAATASNRFSFPGLRAFPASDSGGKYSLRLTRPVRQRTTTPHFGNC